MMDRQLADLHERGEPIAVLRASEAAIYGRFGYATGHPRADHRAAAARPPRFAPGRPASARAVLDAARPRPRCAPSWPRCTTRSARGTPGFIGRNDAAWTDVLHDPEHRRGGATRAAGGAAARRRHRARLRAVPGARRLVRRPAGRAGGRAGAGRRRPGRRGGPLAARPGPRPDRDRPSRGGRPVDDPLLRLLADPRRARARVMDGLWLRLVRLGEALAARRYAAPVDLVLEVTDARCPWNAGRWRLAGDEPGADLRAAAPTRPTCGWTPPRWPRATSGTRCSAATPRAGRSSSSARGAAPAGHRDGLDAGPVVPASLLTARRTGEW